MISVLIAIALIVVVFIVLGTNLQTPCTRLFDGASIPYTPTSANNPGDVVLIGTANNIVTITTDAISANQLGAIFLGGVFVCPKDASTFNLGDPVYWNATGNPTVGTAGTGCMTSTSLGNVFAGTACAAQVTGDATVEVKLTGAAKGTPSGGSASAITAQGSLATVGAGTITGALIADGLILRGGLQTAAFTDTTDTAANITAALPALGVGQSFEFTYQNGTGYTATIAGGSNVTVAATVGPGAWVKILLTKATATTYTGLVVSAGANYGSLPLFQQSTGTTTTTFTAGELTGAQDTTYVSTATTPGSIATRTATQMFGDIPNAFIGMTWKVRICNQSGSANSLTLTAGSGVTLSGKTTYVITEFGFADFICTFTSATAMTMVFAGAGVGTTV